MALQKRNDELVDLLASDFRRRKENVYLSSNRYIEIGEMTAPDAPSSNRARLFCRDNGGKTELCARFATGAIQVIATEP